MGKAVRKPRPSPPHWYWLDVDTVVGIVEIAMDAEAVKG